MLAQVARFIIVNNSGQTLTYDSNGRINLVVKGVITDPSTGKVTYNDIIDDTCGFGAGDTTVNGGEDLSSEYVNTANLDVSMLVQLEITHDAGTAADGTFDIYYDPGDATGQLCSDASGYDDAETNKLTHIGSLTWHASGVDDQMMRSPVFAV